MLRVEKEYLNAQLVELPKIWRLCQYHYEGLFLCGLPKFIVRKRNLNNSADEETAEPLLKNL